jgi:hypothetical protein
MTSFPIDDRRHAGDHARQQVLEARAARGGQRQQLAVTAHTGRHPQQVDDVLIGFR